MCETPDVQSAKDKFEKAISRAEDQDGELSYGIKNRVYETREQLHEAMEKMYGDDWLDVTDFDDLFARAKVVLKEIPKPDEPKIKKRRSGRAMKLGEDGGSLGNNVVRPYG